MTTWNELFERGEGIARFPEREVQEFVSLLERRFAERPLCVWDLCGWDCSPPMAMDSTIFFPDDGTVVAAGEPLVFVEPGSFSVNARATDIHGNVQPSEGAPEQHNGTNLT